MDCCEKILPLIRKIFNEWMYGKNFYYYFYKHFYKLFYQQEVFSIIY